MGYTVERNAQILIYLMKAHGVRKIIISPGGTNCCFAYSVQQDGWFEVYNAVDERSAAYMACGLSEESGEPVALNCTGATSSRNYLSGLTEAYYRKLPVLAITSSQRNCWVGQLIPQITNRSAPPPDTAKLSLTLTLATSELDEWHNTLKANKALLELRHRGGGPVHINLETEINADYSVQELLPARIIRRIGPGDLFPELPQGKIGIYCGTHSKWDPRLTDCVEKFCEQCNAVVLHDHSSNYTGKHGIPERLVLSQRMKPSFHLFDLVVHFGEVSVTESKPKAKEVWRVATDGEIQDPYLALTHVFEMEESAFFEHYVADTPQRNEKEPFYRLWQGEYEGLVGRIPELPFSNPWIAQQTLCKIPSDAALHLGISITAISWNYFKAPENLLVYSNAGGYGIDGCVSSLLGASLANQNKLFFGVVGDLAFFYDMNVLGNRHFGSNIRLLVINNGRGGLLATEENSVRRAGGLEASLNLSAAGHFGRQSPQLVKNYAENLGIRYLSASSKEEYLAVLPEFVNPAQTGKSILLEAFVDYDDENTAYMIMRHLKE